MPVPLEVFCCYAREDQELLEHLKKNLVPLQRSGQITIWSETNLNAGIEWEKELHKHLESADVILLLISPDFMASDYCYSIEMKRAIERHDQGIAYIFPILLRPTHWENAPFAQLQVIPTNATPVTKWFDRDDAFHDVTSHIKYFISNPPIQQTSVKSVPPATLDSPVPASSLHENILTASVLTVSTPTSGTGGAPPTHKPPLPPSTSPGSPPLLFRLNTKAAVKPLKATLSRRWVRLSLAGLVIAALASGSIWLLIPHEITTFAIPTAQSKPWEITAGPDGNLRFTEYFGNKIGRITPSGSITEFPLPIANSGPQEITAGPDGNLWFTEEFGIKIGRITPSGTITEFAANSGLWGITTGPDRNLWFAEFDGNNIGRISPRGK